MCQFFLHDHRFRLSTAGWCRQRQYERLPRNLPPRIVDGNKVEIPLRVCVALLLKTTTLDTIDNSLDTLLNLPSPTGKSLISRTNQTSKPAPHLVSFGDDVPFFRSDLLAASPVAPAQPRQRALPEPIRIGRFFDPAVVGMHVVTFDIISQHSTAGREYPTVSARNGFDEFGRTIEPADKLILQCSLQVNQPAGDDQQRQDERRT